MAIEICLQVPRYNDSDFVQKPTRSQAHTRVVIVLLFLVFGFQKVEAGRFEEGFCQDWLEALNWRGWGRPNAPRETGAILNRMRILTLRETTNTSTSSSGSIH